MANEHLKAAFSLGIKIAEHVHGIERTGDDDSNDAIFEALQTVADGDFTLLGTPEEEFKKLPTPPAPLRAKMEQEFYEVMRISRENQRNIAKLILEAID